MKRRQYLSGLVAAGGLAITGVSAVSAEETVAEWIDQTGDDAGPGNYTYPETDQIPEGELDLSSFSITSTSTEFQLRFTFANGLNDPGDWGGDNGFSHQHIQVYFRDPSADGGVSESLAGPNVTFEKPYHHRLILPPFPNEMKIRLEDQDGNAVSYDIGVTTENGDTIVATLPRTDLGYLTDAQVAPLVMAWDGYGEGGVRAVQGEDPKWHFAGGENGNAPRVLDLVTPSDVSQSDALAYSADAKATVPYVDVTSGGYDATKASSGDDGGSQDNTSSEDSSSSSDDSSSSEDSSSSSDDSSSSEDSSSSSEEGSSSEDSSSSESSSDGLPGFGVAAGVAGTVGGALAAKRADEDDE